MTLLASTGLRNQLLTQDSLQTVLAYGCLKIYAGTVPSTADASLGSATLLCTITSSGTGVGILLSSTATSGAVPKAPGEVWSGANVASGTATFFRHVLLSDDGTSSTTQPRLQGTIATSAADMIMTSTSLTAAAITTIDSYSVTWPA